MEDINYSLTGNVCCYHRFGFRAKPREKHYLYLDKNVQGQTVSMRDSGYGNPNRFIHLALGAHQRLLRA